MLLQSEDCKDTKTAATPGNEERCCHPLLNNGVCCLCKKPINDSSAVPLNYIQKHLTISTQAMDQVRELKLKDLLRKEKLCLILDLDHTLLHTVWEQHLRSSRDKDIYSHVTFVHDHIDPTGDLYKTTVDGYDLLTKLRPYVRVFLEEASKIFDLYVYTMGTRAYALQMAQLLDPEKKYFGPNVISAQDYVREDDNGGRIKSLNVVMAPKRVVLIMDDTREVWSMHEENLVHITRYYYFDQSDSVSGNKEDESEADGTLASVLKQLKFVHQSFFNSELDVDYTRTKDVRQILRR